MLKFDAVEALADTLSPVTVAPAVDRPQRSSLLMYAVASALAIALLLPLLTVEIPPLLDYPNHLARMFILAHGASDPFFSRVYEQHWSIIPNIAIDALMPPLLSFMPLYAAGKLVLALTLLLPVAGTVAYSRATLRVDSLWPLASGLVAYNSLFLMGFMNFLISVGIAMLAAALWIRLRPSRPLLAVIILAPGAVFLFFMHIFGLALFGLLIGMEELVQLFDVRRRGEPVLRPALMTLASLTGVFVVPAILYAMSSLEQAPGAIGWEPLPWKLVRLFDPFLQYGLAAGFGTALIVLGIIFVLVRTRHALLSRPAMLAIAVLLVLYAIVPFELKGTAYIDTRLPIMARFVLFASFAPKGLPRRDGIAVGLVLGLMFVLRLVSMTLTWQGQTTDLAELRRVIAPVPPGSRVLSVVVMIGDAPQYWEQIPPHRVLTIGDTTFMHLPALLVTERDSIWPLLFTEPTKQPLLVRSEFRAVTIGEGVTPGYHSLRPSGPSQVELEKAPYLADWQDKFDYVLVLLAGGADDLQRLRPDRLDLVAQADFAALFRVRQAPPPVSQ